MFQSDLFPTGEHLPSEPLAYATGTRIAALLASGRHLTRADISGLFAEETGVQGWGSAWTIDDYNNAVEIGALLWLRESSRIDLATSVHEAEARFDWLEAALPPRHVRSEGQVELQQFSTPPMLAWLMAKAAAVCARHAPRTVRRQWRPCSLGQRPERFAAHQRDRSGKTRRPGPRLPFGHVHCA